jgi:primosomal protein N' (replication factor Y)
MRNRKTTLTPFARELRKGSTDTERKLWALLRNRALLGCKFRRQFPIAPYITDFACIEKRLVVELDGGQHVDQAEHDEQRTAFLKAEGYTALRFWDNDVLLRTQSVMEQIFSSLDADAPLTLTLSPSAMGRGSKSR